MIKYSLTVTVVIFSKVKQCEYICLVKEVNKIIVCLRGGWDLYLF